METYLSCFVQDINILLNYMTFIVSHHEKCIQSNTKHHEIGLEFVREKNVLNDVCTLFLYLQPTGYSVVDGAILGVPKRTRGTHRKSRTLPDAYSSDKALSKFRESSGIADLNTGK